ncbi:MAG: tRNA-(ms[2]io[6]A)-hydroxylase [Pseudomonadales bacterium]|nr:tRNA-(ms[2]io[6]A)-hydroxylase [Pseudomonadales bacterium]
MLKVSSSDEWLDCVINDMDTFLPQHATAEKKASGMALSLVSHYPDKSDIVKTMTDIAIEELAHFRDVLKLMQERNLLQCRDEKDGYVLQLRNHFRKGSEDYLMDRLLAGAIIEARGAERFGLIAETLPESKLKTFYKTITQSEERHHEVFISLARKYFDDEAINKRLDILLEIEARILEALPVRCTLH